METIIGVLSIVFVLAVLAYAGYFNLHDKDLQIESKEEDMMKPKEQDEVPNVEEKEELANVDKNEEVAKPDTMGLMYDALCNLGCQPTKNDDHTISVKYQGENFEMQFDGLFARVWDPMWAGINHDDPNMSLLREAVNVANFDFGPTVVFTAPNSDGIVGLHSRMDILLHPACPVNPSYVKTVLDSFFDMKNCVRQRCQQLSFEQSENMKNRRPVGFARE